MSARSSRNVPRFNPVSQPRQGDPSQLQEGFGGPWLTEVMWIHLSPMQPFFPCRCARFQGNGRMGSPGSTSGPWKHLVHRSCRC